MRIENLKFVWHLKSVENFSVGLFENFLILRSQISGMALNVFTDLNFKK